MDSLVQELIITIHKHICKCWDVPPCTRCVISTDMLSQPITFDLKKTRNSIEKRTMSVYTKSIDVPRSTEKCTIHRHKKLMGRRTSSASQWNCVSILSQIVIGWDDAPCTRQGRGWHFRNSNVEKTMTLDLRSLECARKGAPKSIRYFDNPREIINLKTIWVCAPHRCE